jgi:hypothetical protein
MTRGEIQVKQYTEVETALFTIRRELQELADFMRKTNQATVEVLEAQRVSVEKQRIAVEMEWARVRQLREIAEAAVKQEEYARQYGGMFQ